jgi:hypothetical protein
VLVNGDTKRKINRGEIVEFTMIVKKISHLDGFAFEAFCHRLFRKKYIDYYSTRAHKDGGIDGVIVSDHHVFSMTTEKNLKAKAVKDIERVIEQHNEFLKNWTFVTNRNYDDHMLTVVLPTLREKYPEITIEFIGADEIASIATEITYANQTELQSIFGIIDDPYLDLFQNLFRHQREGVAEYDVLHVVNLIRVLYNEELTRGIVNPVLWKKRLESFPKDFKAVHQDSGTYYSPQYLWEFSQHPASQYQTESFLDFQKRYEEFLINIKGFSLLRDIKMESSPILEVW